MLTDIELESARALAEKLIDYLEGCAQEWGRKHEDEVIAAAIDPAKEMSFCSGVADTASATPLLAWLNSIGLIESREFKGGKRFALGKDEPGQKEFFTELHRGDQYAEQVGVIYGNRLANMKSRWLVSRLAKGARRIRPRKDWSSYRNYFACAWDKLTQSGFRPSLIIVPGRAYYGQFRHITEFQFGRGTTEHLEPLGHWRGIPVVDWEGFTDQCMVVATENCFHLLEDGLVCCVDLPNRITRLSQLSVSLGVTQKVQIRWLDQHAAIIMKVKSSTRSDPR